MSIVVDIKKKIGTFALDINFEAGDEVVGLLGASGCGKSMTLRCIAGIVRPNEGHISINGRVLFDSSRGIDLPPQQRRSGLLFQNYALFPNMTVRENICAAISLSKKKDEPRYEELAEKFFIGGLDDQYPSELSGGQQQRVALARMAANGPEIFMLDEPLAALDSYLRWQIEREMMDLFERSGVTVLYVSHNRDEVFRICSRVCVIHDGKNEEIQSARDLFERPATVASCILSGCKNFSRAEKIGSNEVFAADWGAALTCASPVPDDISAIGVRAHFFKPCGSDGENSFECRVVRVVEDLFSTSVTLRATAVGEPRRWSDIQMELPKEVAFGIKKYDILNVQAVPSDVMVLSDKNADPIGSANYK